VSAAWCYQTRIELQSAIVAIVASGALTQIHVRQRDATQARRAVQTRSVYAVVDGRVAQSTGEAHQTLTRVRVQAGQALGVVATGRRGAHVHS
jgi:Cu/Zn superoxide dismutase